MAEVKRLNYFNSQFLKERDFQDEQAYHIQMRRLQNQRLQTWGIVYGLDVTQVNNTEISVTSGMAIDKDGREIVLPADPPPGNFNLSSLTGNAVVYLTLAYAEVFDPSDRSPGGSGDQFIRTTERPKPEIRSEAPPTDGSVIVLAKVTLVNGKLAATSLDLTARSPLSTPVIAPRSITLDKLVPNAITATTLGVLPISGGVMSGTIGFANAATPMVYIFQSGDNNPERPVIAHSPSFPTWGLSYRDIDDTMIFQSNGTPVMAIDLVNKNVGIGLAKPTTKLHVVGNTLLTGGDLTFQATADDPGDIIFQDAANRQKARIWSQPAAGAAGLFLSSGDNNPDITIDPNGNVGVGTASPAARFHVAGGTTILQQEPWQTPALQNGWGIYGNGYSPPGFFKDSMGIIHLRGLVNSGAMQRSIFILPDGYRPQFRELFVVGCFMAGAPNRNGSGFGRVDVLASGEVLPVEGENLWISLDGITFRVAPPPLPRIDIGPVIRPIDPVIIRPNA